MDPSLAKGVLDGIVSSVCRELNTDPELYRIKPGGTMLGHSLTEWYVTIVSPATAKETSRNTRRARRIGLIKTNFIITRESPDAPIVLKIHEWDASKDWKKGERIIFELPADDMKARRIMADYLKAAILRSGNVSGIVKPAASTVP
jgi:hypothetical protein